MTTPRVNGILTRQRACRLGAGVLTSGAGRGTGRSRWRGWNHARPSAERPAPVVSSPDSCPYSRSRASCHPPRVHPLPQTHPCTGPTPPAPRTRPGHQPSPGQPTPQHRLRPTARQASPLPIVYGSRPKVPLQHTLTGACSHTCDVRDSMGMDLNAEDSDD